MSRKKTVVLVVDQDVQNRRFLKTFLGERDFKVRESLTGAQTFRQLNTARPELVIADTRLPDISAAGFLDEFRQRSDIPLIIYSENNDEEEAIRMLSAGADDYVSKPYSPEMMLARIKACLRRVIVAEAGKPALTNGHIQMDLLRHEVSVNGKTCMLTPKEYDLLRYFMTHRGKMITHRQLLKALWGPMHIEHMQYLRVYVSQLREKIEPSPCKPAYIVTEPGVGYRMEIVS